MIAIRPSGNYVGKGLRRCLPPGVRAKELGRLNAYFLVSVMVNVPVLLQSDNADPLIVFESRLRVSVKVRLLQPSAKACRVTK